MADLNWIKIENNWNQFVDTFHLQQERVEQKFGYGYKDIFLAHEEFNEFSIFYENKFTKSSQLSTAANVGHSLLIYAPIIAGQPIQLKVKRKRSLFGSFRKNHQARIVSDTAMVNQFIPLIGLKSLWLTMPDAELSIGKMEIYGDRPVSPNQLVIKLSSQSQPQLFEEWKLARMIITQMLTNLASSNKISPI